MENEKLLYFPNFCLSARVKFCQPFIEEPLQRWKSVKRKKNWLPKLLRRSNKAARHCQNRSRALQHTLLFSSPKVFTLRKWSLDGCLLLRPPAETVVGVQGRTWMRADQGNSFLPPPAASLGGQWNSLGWTCWEVSLPLFRILSLSLCFLSPLTDLVLLSIWAVALATAEEKSNIW